MKNKHGGKREGAKRPPLYSVAMKRKEVMLPDEAIEFFLALGNGNLSAGVRQAWRSLTQVAADGLTPSAKSKGVAKSARR